MDHAHNPEAGLLERIEALEVEARDVKRRRDQAPNADDREAVDRQLREVEQQIERLRRHLKRMRS